VAAIYLNTMSTKISNVEARERQRRRQSESSALGLTPNPKTNITMDQQESGGVRLNAQIMNRSQLYGADAGSHRPISKFRQDLITKRNGRAG